MAKGMSLEEFKVALSFDATVEIEKLKSNIYYYSKSAIWSACSQYVG